MEDETGRLGAPSEVEDLTTAPQQLLNMSNRTRRTRRRTRLKCSIATCTTKEIISWKFLGKAKLDHLVCQSCSLFFENKTELLSSANVQKLLEMDVSTATVVSGEHLSQTITPTRETTRVKKTTTHSNQGEIKQNKVGQIGQEGVESPVPTGCEK